MHHLVKLLATQAAGGCKAGKPDILNVCPEASGMAVAGAVEGFHPLVCAVHTESCMGLHNATSHT